MIARSRALRRALLCVALCAGATRAGAQVTVTLTGVVHDAASGAPLIGAIVTLGAGAEARSARSDGAGAFEFQHVPVGSYVVTTRRLGFEPARETVDVSPENHAITISLTRVARLDTVRVRAAQQAIYGAVGTSNDLRPLPKATIQVFGATLGNATVDSTGHFFFPVRAPGAYLVRARLDGYETQTVSITVPANDGVEVALLLDSARGPVSHMLEMAYADLRERLAVRRSASAFIPRTELLEHGASEMLTALRYSRSFVQKSLRMGPTACVFVDGNPRVGYSINAIDPREVEAIELYAGNAEASGTLARRWPRSAPCGDTGMPFVTPGNDVVNWVVIWLKH